MARILLVEDDENLLYIYSRYLTHFGHTVEAAPTADEAKRAIGAHRPHVVIAVIGRRTLDWQQLLPQLQDALQNVPIVGVRAAPLSLESTHRATALCNRLVEEAGGPIAIAAMGLRRRGRREIARQPPGCAPG